MGIEVKMTVIPMCCLHPEREAEYDARLARHPQARGSWGYVCGACFRNYGPGRLGTAHGQRLVLRDDGADAVHDSKVDEELEGR